MRKTMWAVIAGLAMVAGPAVAQQQQQGDREVEVQAGETQIQIDPAERRGAAQRDGQVRPEGRRSQAGQAVQAENLAVRATNLDGMEIRNMQDEELGQVDDVVIDLQTGRVRYLAMSTGGVLGVGEKLFAVPWDAFRYRMQDGEQYLVLNATAQMFENAPGFDDNNWPNFADRQWRMTNDRFYGDQGFIETERRANRGDAQRQRVRRPATNLPETNN